LNMLKTMRNRSSATSERGPARNPEGERDVAAFVGDILASAPADPLPAPPEVLAQAADLGIAFEPGEVEKLGRFLALLLHASGRMNLTAIREPQEAWQRHILDSLTLMAPLADLPEGATADYINTGAWSQKAIKEAKLFGNVHIAASSEDSNFDHIPASPSYSDSPAYLHFTSNNTIFGTEFSSEPECPDGAFLVCDASSDIFSRPIDVTKYGLIYAGAQKNLGPSGVTLVIMRKDLAERSERTLPSMGLYKTYAENDSRYNTPPVFGVYVMGVVFEWILENGGLSAMAERNAAKAQLIYDALDAGFYKPHAKEGSRSMMNITFNCPSDDLNKAFLKEAQAQGFDGLKGHRSVGGIRASIYNAFPASGCQALARFMRDFAQKNG